MIKKYIAFYFSVFVWKSSCCSKCNDSDHNPDFFEASKSNVSKHEKIPLFQISENSPNSFLDLGKLKKRSDSESDSEAFVETGRKFSKLKKEYNTPFDHKAGALQGSGKKHKSLSYLEIRNKLAGRELDSNGAVMQLNNPIYEDYLDDCDKEIQKRQELLKVSMRRRRKRRSQFSLGEQAELDKLHKIDNFGRLIHNFNYGHHITNGGAYVGGSKIVINGQNFVQGSAINEKNLGVHSTYALVHIPEGISTNMLINSNNNENFRDLIAARNNGRVEFYRNNQQRVQEIAKITQRMEREFTYPLPPAVDEKQFLVNSDQLAAAYQQNSQSSWLYISEGRSSQLQAASSFQNILGSIKGPLPTCSYFSCQMWICGYCKQMMRRSKIRNYARDYMSHHQENMKSGYNVAIEEVFVCPRTISRRSTGSKLTLDIAAGKYCELKPLKTTYVDIGGETCESSASTNQMRMNDKDVTRCDNMFLHFYPPSDEVDVALAESGQYGSKSYKVYSEVEKDKVLDENSDRLLEKKSEDKSEPPASSFPVWAWVLIGIVLVVALAGGGYWFATSGNAPLSAADGESGISNYQNANAEIVNIPSIRPATIPN